MKVIGCQLDVVWEDPARNMDAVRSLLAAEEIPAESLIVLPELFATGYSMDTQRIVEPVPSPTLEFLVSLAREHDSTVVGGMAAAGQGGRARNEAVAVGPGGGVLARYAKMYPFSAAGETEHYEPGDNVLSFAAGGFVVCPFVCYDLRFPEVFRAAVRRGAELFVVIANWPAARIGHWETLLRARAIENQAFVVGINRVGSDPNFNFPGHSLIIDPHGNVLAQAGETAGIVSAELDPLAVSSWRREFPALKDIRPDFIP